MKTTSDLKMTNYVSITTLNRRNQGFTGSGVWLDFLFFENIIYIFLRDSLLNVFIVFIVFLFFFYSFMRCSPPWKQMKDILREAIVEKHHNHVLSSYRCWRCMWLRLSVCEWVFVRIHQGVIWNYFWRRRSISIANFFWYWKKKKKRSPCSIVAHLLLSPSTSLPFHI